MATSPLLCNFSGCNGTMWICLNNYLGQNHTKICNFGLNDIHELCLFSKTEKNPEDGLQPES